MPGFEEFREQLLRQLSGKPGQISQLLVDILENAESERDFEKFAEELNRRRGENQERYSLKRRNLGVFFQRVQSLEDEYKQARIKAERELIARDIDDQLNQLENAKEVAQTYQRNVRLLTLMINKTEQVVAQLASGLTEESIDLLGTKFGDEALKWDGLYDAAKDLKEARSMSITEEEETATDRSDKSKIHRREPEADENEGLPERLRRRKAELLGPETE